MITDEDLEKSILRYQEKARKKGWNGKLIWEVLDERESHDYIKSIGRQVGRKEKEQEFNDKGYFLAWAVDEKILKAKEELLKDVEKIIFGTEFIIQECSDDCKENQARAIQEYTDKIMSKLNSTELE